jgi:hypothetical protein
VTLLGQPRHRLNIIAGMASPVVAPHPSVGIFPRRALGRMREVKGEVKGKVKGKVLPNT